MERRLRTAVVGLGRIGWQFHLPSIREYPSRFELVGVADPLEERRREAEQVYGARGFADLSSLLAATKPELIVLASPTHLHADQALEAMRSGADVFCDKPMAPTLEEADRIIAGMRATGRRFMVYQPKRLGAEVTAIRSVLDRGVLGPIFQIQRRCGWYTRRNDWQAWKKYGGGMLNNYGAHALDELLHLAGGRARRIAAHLKRVATLGDADDVVRVLLETEAGVTLDLEINMAMAFTPEGWCVCGRTGTLWSDASVKGFRLKFFDPASLGPGAVDEGLAANGRRYGNEEVIPWKEEIVPLPAMKAAAYYEKVYEYYALGRPPFVPVEETREVMRVMAEARRDAGWRQE